MTPQPANRKRDIPKRNHITKIHRRRYMPQHMILIETDDEKAIAWWRKLTPVERGQAIAAIAHREE